MSTTSSRQASRVSAKPATSVNPARRGLRDITNVSVTTASGSKGNNPLKPTRRMTKRPKIESQSTDITTTRAARGNMEISTTSAETINPELDNIERGISSMGLGIDSPKPISQRAYVDIDKDLSDADAEARIIADIHEILREKEGKWSVNPTYFQDQPVINERMREILVDWMVDIHKKFKYVTGTLFLAIMLMDRYLENRPTARNQLQLVGITAFMVAAKYEEIVEPEIADLVHLTDGTYTGAQLVAFETIFLKTLEFTVMMPSVEEFRVRYVKAALGGDTVPEGGDTVSQDRNEMRRFNYLSAYYTQLSLLKCHFLRYLPSTIAAASVFLARKTLGMTPVWHGTLSHYTKYEAEEILPCARALTECVVLASRQHSAIRRKFSYPCYFAVGTMNPPELD